MNNRQWNNKYRASALRIVHCKLLFKKGRSMKRIFLFIAAITSVLLILLSACNKKPTAPKADNPFDPANVQTSGDPFKLTAKIANGGILLQWTKPPMKNLKSFNIYRSEQEKGTYKKIKNISANTTNFTDINIENGHSYWYVVTAVTNNGNESSRTNITPVNINANPVLTINGGDPYTPTRAVNLTILAATATQMMLSNQADFAGAQWEAYATGKNWTLPSGDGEKTVYLKVKYENGQESQPVSAAIKPQPMNPSIVIIADTVEYTPTRNVTLKLSAAGANLKMKLSEDSTFNGVQWQNYQSNPAFQLSAGKGTKKVYAKFKNDFEIESDLVFDTIEPQPMNPSITIANGAQYTVTRNVTLHLSATGSNLEMKLSEDPSFNGVDWQPYQTNTNFQLSLGGGTKKVYAKFKNDFEIESDLVFDTIEPQPVINTSIQIAQTDTTNTLDVTLYLHAEYAKKMMICNDSAFAGCQWENYAQIKPWHLDFSKANNYTATVYAKFKNDFEMATQPIQDKIYLRISSGIKINNDAQYTSTRAVTLTLFSENADQMMISNNADFSGAIWEDYVTTKSWTLPTGNGPFTVYAKFKNASGLISQVYSDEILPQPMNPAITIANGAQYTATRNVTLRLLANGANLMMKLSEDSTFNGVQWQNYQSNPAFQLSAGKGTKKVYAKFKNDFEIESDLVYDTIEPQPMNPSISIANNAQYTTTRNVQLNLNATGSNLKMKLSEDSTFCGVQWQNYQSDPSFQLSTGDGTKKVYAIFKNDFEIESDLVFDTIEPQPMNPSITIANGAQYSTTRNVTLKLSAIGANLKMKLSEDSTFNGVQWQNYQSNPTFQLSTGDGTKKVYAKFKNDFEIESPVLKDDIIMDTTPPIAVLTVTPDSGITNETTFQFDPTASHDNLASQSDLRVRYDWQNDGTYDTDWQELRITNYEFQIGGGDKTIKLQLKDGAGWQVETIQTIFVNTRPQAEFTATQTSYLNKLIVHFDASQSLDYEDGHYLKCRWDFDGDGIFDTNWLTEDTISHQYADYGTYKVKLNVKDKNALTNVNEQSIEVTPPLIKTIFVEGGTFEMGCTSEQSDCYNDALPVHTVTVNSLYIGKYEVTNAQVVEVFNWALQQGKITISSTTLQNAEGDQQELLDLDANKCQISYDGTQLYVENNYDDYPVIEISWYGAAAFCNYLSEREGLTPVYNLSDWSADWNANGYRLPTEAEWEYASRGGAFSQGYRYSGSNIADEVAWYWDNSYADGNSNLQTYNGIVQGTLPVGTKKCNELGIYDMSGNVWEWCWDWYSDSYYNISPNDNPKGPDSGLYRVMRGGGWASNTWGIQVSARQKTKPSDSFFDLGFRVSRKR